MVTQAAVDEFVDAPALRRAYTRFFASLERTYTAKRFGLDADTMRGAWPRK